MIKSHPSVTTSPESGRTGNLLSKKADSGDESASNCSSKAAFVFLIIDL